MTNSFSEYMLAQSRKETACERYNYASSELENAKIKERLAALKSQAEPMASLLQIASDQDRLYATAFYVVVGRMPE